MADLIFARDDGQWFDLPGLRLAAMSGNRLVVPTKADLMPLPEGATLTMMPQTLPVGFDDEAGEFLALGENPYKKNSEPVHAVAALLPQGFTRLYLPAVDEPAANLPLLGYTAVGVEKGRLVVAAQQSDAHDHWHPAKFNTPQLPQLVQRLTQALPENRILAQLAHCALTYGCFTAQNIFYRRWEGGIPASPSCNADCLGCISLQESECCPSPQQRIDFSPSAAEIAEIAIPHLQQAEQGMISFGQGCEGEPSLAYAVIAEAIGLIRAATPKGKININSNAGSPEAIRALVAAGLDQMRVSLFSPIASEYSAYHRPRGYTPEDVLANAAYAAAQGVQVSLNLLVYPGFSDRECFLSALIDWLRQSGVRQLQLRNLNCPPQLMADFCGDTPAIGMRQMIDRLQAALPELRIGSYSEL